MTMPMWNESSNDNYNNLNGNDSVHDQVNANDNPNSHLYDNVFYLWLR